MKTICLLLFVSFFTSVFPTKVISNVILRCKRPRELEATVFLMERDWGDNEIDNDDTLSFGVYRFQQIPEMKLELRGEEYEFLGLDVYLNVYHSCSNVTGEYIMTTVQLKKHMYKSREFHVIIDLDTEKSVIKETVLIYGLV